MNLVFPCRLMLSYLQGRSQFVSLNGVNSSLLQLYSGVPQGSVLGPLLFILYINDLPNSIDTDLCRPYLFADDVALLFSCDRNTPNTLQNNIDYCLGIVRDWTSRNYLRINASKTKGIVFSPYDRFRVDLNISINGVRVNFMSKVKLLGVLLDSELNFGAQIDVVICRVFQILRKLNSINVFYPTLIRYKLAYALMMSQVMYGLEVISGTTSSNISKIRRIVNTIVRFVYGVRRREHVSGYVRKFLGCDFLDFLKFRNLTLFYRIVKTTRPLRLFNRFSFSHSTRNSQIFIPRIRNSFFEGSFLVRAARLWNHLPTILRVFSHSNNVFRLKLLSYLSNAEF